MTDTAIVILAAGNSSRLGKPKQLLMHDGKTLLQHAIDEAIKTGLAPIVAVLGSNAESIAQTVCLQPVEIAINPQWQEGMASSIAAGISKIISLNAAIKNIILAVCDQPFLSSQTFEQLADKKSKTGKGIVASSYKNIIGTPVLFSKTYFEKLLQLKGDEGAKKILRSHQQDVVSIPFPKGEIDIDTAEDYVRLSKLQPEE